MSSKQNDTAMWAAKQNRRQKWLTRTLAAALWSALVLIVTLYWLDRPRVITPRPSAAVPKGVRQALTGFTMTRTNQGHPLFTIEASRTLEMKKDGRAVLQGVRVQFTNPLGGGRQAVLITPSAQYNPLTGDLTTTNSVELELNAPSMGGKSPAGSAAKQGSASAGTMILKTSAVDYVRKSSQVESDAPVSFQIGRAQGKAIGLKYETVEGRLELERNVRVEYRPATAAAPIQLTASNLTFSRATNQAVLQGPVVITQGARVVHSAAVTIALDAQNQIRDVHLSGGVAARATGAQGRMSLSANNMRLSFNSAGSLQSATAQGDILGRREARGELATFRAQKATMNFSGRRARPARATFAGNVELASFDSQAQKPAPRGAARPKPSGGARFQCATLNLFFRRHGEGLRRATTAGPGTITLVPADSRLGRRVIQAAQYAMVFNAMNRLVSLTGTGGTKIIFEPAPGGKALPAISTALKLTAQFEPKSEMLTGAVQNGDFRFQEGAWHGRADSAIYSAGDQVIHLAGAPRITDGTTEMQATGVDVNLAKDTAVAEGHVVAARLPTTASAKSADDLATHLLADRAFFDWSAGTAQYAGHVRAWHGSDVLVTPSLALDRKQRTLAAQHGVLSSFLGAPAPNADLTKASGHRRGDAPQPVIIRAERLDYRDATDVATYEGGVTMVAQGATLHADRMDVWIARTKDDQNPTIERAIASGHVRVTQPGRILTATKADYSAARGTIIMTGGPPKVVDKSRGTVSGQRLTFFIRNDRVLVNGGKQSQAVLALPVAP